MKLIILQNKILSSPVQDLQNAVTSTGDDIVSTIKVFATVVSIIGTTTAGLILLVIVLKGLAKSHSGQENVWQDSVGGIFACVFFMALLSAIGLYFFPGI